MPLVLPAAGARCEVIYSIQPRNGIAISYPNFEDVFASGIRRFPALRWSGLPAWDWQYHLNETAAKGLIELVIAEYKRQHDGPPKELFIHVSSNFGDEEWTGFEKGAEIETKVLGIQISDAYDDLKLFRMGNYPTIRGTALALNDRSAYLWTSGFVPRLDTYMGPETPNPILVRVQRGECDLRIVLSDVLGLTKINFNSCLFNDRLPVTIKFANEVGDVLISAPIDGEPRLPFKFYI